MKLKVNNSEQKLRGAYYTPFELADKIVKLFNLSNIKDILEPSCGDGVFIDALVNNKFLSTNKKITAVEIEKKELRKVEKRYTYQSSLNLVHDDFLSFHERVKNKQHFDLIIGNPPYIRYQYLTEEQRAIVSEIIQENGMKPNKLINIWVCFLVACTKMLSEKGKIAFIIPAELLQVTYAEEVRLFLSNQYSKITLITFKTLVFPDIQQEIVVFIGEKGEEKKGIRIIEMHDLEDFSNLNLDSNGFVPLQYVKEKWTRYFISNKEIDLIQELKDDKRFKKFSEFGTINVGITTGNNDYFSIDKKLKEKYQLADSLLPLIGRSSHAYGIYFTKEDWQINFDKGKKSQLLNFPDAPFEKYPQGYKDYIKKGEEAEINKGYKCKIRDRWYIIPSVWVPDAFFLRRNNLYPKFILNKCHAVSTDTMHRMKFNAGVNPDLLLISYYNSISFAFSEICGRSYGGGVLEILPREMGNILIPDVKSLPQVTLKELISKVDEIVRNNKDIEEALDLVDNEILIGVLKIEQSICVKARQIWKKMQKRRLGRG